MEFNAEEAEALANALPDVRGIFPIPFGLITKQRDGLGGAHVPGFAGEQVAHIRAGTRNAEQTGFRGSPSVRTAQASCVRGARETTRAPDQGRRSAGQSPTRRRGKPHDYIDAAAIEDGSKANAVAEGREDRTAFRGGIAEAHEILHQVGVVG